MHGEWWFLNRTTSRIVQVTVRSKHETTVGRFVTIDKLSTGVPRIVLRCKELAEK